MTICMAGCHATGKGGGSVVVDLLFNFAPIVFGGSMVCPCFVIQYFLCILFCNHLDGEERAGCFTLTVFLMSCDSQCHVALPCGAVGWPAVCDFGYWLFPIILTCFFNH